MNHFSFSLPAGARPAYRANTGGMRAAAGLAAIALVGLQAWCLAAQDGPDGTSAACLPVVELPTVEIRAQRLAGPAGSEALASVSGAGADAAVKLAF